MDQPIFVIKDLVCSYSRGIDVLKISSLEIPRNRFVVLIGKSGSGKSTFLETLGLMNNTIKSGEILFYPDHASGPVSLKDQWKRKNAVDISRIRRDYFSFIFQNTNLMQNFTAYENACLAQMIMGVPFTDAMGKVRATMQTMGLSEVEEWKRAFELSGGQKQRLAFVRAITPVFTVLFGDEPTGNLDEFNSDELMHKLHENIKKFSRTAIIVSHNIVLSSKYADLLIVLFKNEDHHSCSEITGKNIYRRSDIDDKWYDWKNHPVHDIEAEIQHQLEKGAPLVNS